MGYIELIGILLSMLPLGAKRILLQGTNKKKYWTVEAHEDRKIILSKYRHLMLCNMEFVFRMYFIGVVLLVLSHFFLLTVEKSILMFFGANFTETEIKQNAIPLLLMLYTIASYHCYIIFIDRLIGINRTSPKVAIVETIGTILYLISFILNCLLFWHGIQSKYALWYGYYSFIVLLYFIGQPIYFSTHAIYSFKSGSAYSNPDPKLVRLDQDISIHLNQGKELQINLLTNNLYICENDDILISPNIRSPYVVRKESIKYLQIKDVKIVHDGAKWVKLNNQT